MKQFTLKSLLLVLTILMGGVNAWGETYQHVFKTKPSTGNNVTLSEVGWNIEATNLGAYNSGNYAGVQIGTSSKNGSITLTSSSDWNYNGASKITEVRLWLNKGGTSVTPSVSIGGIEANSDGTVVVKNSTAGSDYTKATKVTFTPAENGDKGQVVIDVTTVKAGYICAIEIDCEKVEGEILPPTFSLAEGTYWKEQTLELSTTVEKGTIYYTIIDGSDPTETYSVYPDPIQISKTTTVKAFVKDANGKNSDVVARTYTFVSSIANNPETAYTTAEAIDLIDKTSPEQLAAEDQKVYVKGTVSKVDSYNSGSITYWLDDNTFEVYSGKRLDGANFDAMSDVEVGASVVVYGNVKKFGTTYEFDKNSSLVEYNRNTLSSISISGDPNRVTYEEGESFDWTGLTVTAIFTGENTVDVTNSTTWTVEPDVLTMETTSVTVTATYKDKVATKTIPVTVTKALPKVTLDLSKDETTTATTEKIEWVRDEFTVNSIKFGTTAANNYYPGTSGKSYTSTRFYTNNSFNVIPAPFVCIKEITYTATSTDYANKLANSTWINATASVDSKTVTIVPEDGTKPITATIGGTSGATSIVVSYETVDHAEIALGAQDGEDYYATFSNKNAVEFVDATVYTVNVIGTALKLNEVTSKQVPANTGVLVKSSTNTVSVKTIETASDITSVNLLKPASEEMTGTYTFYKLAYDDYAAKTGLGFYWGANDGGEFTVKAGTAYLAVPNAVSVKGFLLDGTPTAIEGVEAENNTDVIYNLSGQRVQKAQRGLYIVNGKKLMVK